jgi:hypothetical protein
MMRTEAVERLYEAVAYAMRSGCFHPVPEPPAGADMETLIKWGAMRNLHSAFAAVQREGEKGKA